MDYIVVSRKRSTAIIVKFVETYCKDEIELRTSKDNENENSEARDNVYYTIVCYCMGIPNVCYLLQSYYIRGW
ncbi:unnamed protein product [Rhizophagus irregularis]|nr:unnamed protein product [Rhizophagus irregularis]